MQAQFARRCRMQRQRLRLEVHDQFSCHTLPTMLSKRVTRQCHCTAWLSRCSSISRVQGTNRHTPFSHLGHHIQEKQFRIIQAPATFATADCPIAAVIPAHAAFHELPNTCTDNRAATAIRKTVTFCDQRVPVLEGSPWNRVRHLPRITRHA